jgi:aspartate racemase
VQARAPGAATVALLATEGCLRARVYQDALEARGLVSLVPTSKELARVMQLVGSVKIGTHGAKTRAGMRDIALALVERGADAIIAGCTEIPLVLDQEQVPVPLVESTGALARRTVALALGKLPLPAREA